MNFCSLVDHLAGAVKQGGRDCETKCLGGFEVDDKLEPGRLYDRKVGGFGSIEDATHKDAHLEQRIRASLNEGRKGQVDFTVIARVQNNDAPPDSAGSVLDLLHLHFANLAAR